MVGTRRTSWKGNRHGQGEADLERTLVLGMGECLGERAPAWHAQFSGLCPNIKTKSLSRKAPKKSICCKGKDGERDGAVFLREQRGSWANGVGRMCWSRELSEAPLQMERGELQRRGAAQMWPEVKTVTTASRALQPS